MTKSTTVTMGVQQTHLIQGLRNAFTNHINVVGEMLQNARRAGAKSVRIVHDETTFAVHDDGAGINDFQKLVNIGGTDWSDDVSREESPYGLGVLACFFAASHIRIESRGSVLDADTADILGQRPVVVESGASDISGTKIVLSGAQLPNVLEQQIATLVKGFPIPVFYNGHELKRPHAIDGTFVSFDAGHIQPRCLAETGLPTLYLQGLPVGVSNRPRGHGPVVHLDPVTFIGRFPDREVLNNGPECEAAIRAAQRTFVRKVVTAAKERMAMDLATFVGKYADACKAWGCMDLLDDVPFLPGAWFVDLALTNLQLLRWGEQHETCEGTVSKTDLEAGFIDDGDFTAHYDQGFVATLFAQRKAIPCMQRDCLNELRDGHWAKLLRFDASELRLTPIAPRKTTASVDDQGFESLDVVACDGFEIAHATLGAVTVTEENLYTGASHGDHAQIPGDTIFACCGDCDVIDQVATFTDDDDPERSKELACEAFALAYAKASGASELQRFTMLLNQRLDWSDCSAFRDNDFLVRFNEQGSLVVEAPPLAA